VSDSFRALKAVVNAFINRPADENVNPEQLRELIERLELEEERLYETPEERAASDAALAEAIKEIDAMLKRPSS